MLKIHVELWPFGREEDKRTLGTLTIWNDGTGTPQVGHYGVQVDDEPVVAVRDFTRSRGFWELILVALQSRRRRRRR